MINRIKNVIDQKIVLKGVLRGILMGILLIIIFIYLTQKDFSTSPEYIYNQF